MNDTSINPYFFINCMGVTIIICFIAIVIFLIVESNSKKRKNPLVTKPSPSPKKNNNCLYVIPTEVYDIENYVPEKTYNTLEELYEDYETISVHNYSYFRNELNKKCITTYNLYGPRLNLGTWMRVLVKKDDLEKLLGRLVKLHGKQLAYKKFPMLKPPFYYKGEEYVEKDQLELFKDWVTNPRKPYTFPDSPKEGWFFKLGKEYYDSDTPSYWLFLYRKFGILRKGKLNISEE